MKKTVLAALAVAALAIPSLSAHAQKDPTVGGATMYPTKTIVENAVNSPINKTLVAAVKIGAKQLEGMIKKGGGKASLKTVQGEDLTATASGGKIMLTDAKGGM